MGKEIEINVVVDRAAGDSFCQVPAEFPGITGQSNRIGFELLAPPGQVGNDRQAEIHEVEVFSCESDVVHSRKMLEGEDGGIGMGEKR